MSDLIYKVKESMDFLEMRFNKVFIPGKHLSLDESLIRAFGQIKFKVRIITKAARYGSKVYVITDADSTFVLMVLVYSGKTMFHVDQNAEMKKAVQVVKALCDPYKGTHCTIYIYWFYMLIDLQKEMDKMDLYVTGTTVMKNSPKGANCC
jgi:Transposase IS4